MSVLWNCISFIIKLCNRHFQIEHVYHKLWVQFFKKTYPSQASELWPLTCSFLFNLTRVVIMKCILWPGHMLHGYCRMKVEQAKCLTRWLNTFVLSQDCYRCCLSSKWCVWVCCAWAWTPAVAAFGYILLMKQSNPACWTIYGKWNVLVIFFKGTLKSFYL